MVRRVATVSDPALAIGRAAVAELPPPVVMPVRRVEERVEAIEREPALPFIEVPVVRKRALSEAAAESAISAVVTRLDPPPERVAPVLDPVSVWPEPVPPFTALFGAAGSGKTFATKLWAEQRPGILLAATTGIAAVNLGGETINSILGYFDTQSLQEAYINGSLTARLGKLWKVGVRRLVVDEVSMLAGDQLTYLVRAVEEVNNRGYVLGKWTDDDDGPPPAMGLTLVGDFCQLAPVKAPYAFESEEWGRFADATITLTAIRRQSDAAFIEMLRAARAGRGDLVAQYFEGRGAIHQETDDHFDGATIVAKNDSVDRYNALRMDRLPGPRVTFPSVRWGKLRSEWGQLEKPKHTWGIPEVLQLKEGALVMVLNNQRDDCRQLTCVNGDLGTLQEAEDGTAFVGLQRTGEIVRVLPVTRVVRVPADATRRAELRKAGHGDRIDGKWEIVGEITYMPLRVAYASTVHKSQGLSLDSVQVNIRDHFFKSPGMLYVALSRARTAEGLRLVGSPAAITERCTTDPRLRDWL
jgi:hypothetical protein